MLSVGSLFSGIGGMELGLERTGHFRTKWFVENDAYASAVLARQWKGVRNYGDITKVKWEEIERVDVLTGGFPCQPFSIAGKRKGEKDERALWSFFLEAIRQVKPKWVLAENVPGLLSVDSGRAFRNILASLAQERYDVEWFTLRASDFGVPHRRERLFIVAYPQSQQDKWLQQQRLWGNDNSKAAASDTEGFGLEANAQLRFPNGSEGRVPEYPNSIEKGNVANSSSVGCSTRGSDWEERQILPAQVRKASEGESEGNGWKFRADENPHIIADTSRYGSEQKSEHISSEDFQAGYSLQFQERPTAPRIIADDWGERIQRFNEKLVERSQGFTWAKDVRRVEDFFNRQDIPEPLIRRKDYGVSRGLVKGRRRSDYQDRIKCLGNAVVPQVAQFIGELIWEAENANKQRWEK